jgi:hypothetical protein
MSRTSSIPVVHRPVAHPVTFPHLPLVMLSAASMGDLAVVTPALPLSMVAPVESLTLVESTPKA